MISQNKTPVKRLRRVLKVIFLSSLFGAAAFVTLLAELTIPIPGTSVVMDPRELFVTIGAALTGPLGGALTGLLAGVGAPGGVPLASMLAHLLGGIWIGITYKHLLHPQSKMPLLLVGWAGLVLAYYYLFLMPGFTHFPHLLFADFGIIRPTLALRKCQKRCFCPTYSNLTSKERD